MPGSVSERVQLAKQKEEAKKETRKQRKEKERLAQKHIFDVTMCNICMYASRRMSHL